MGWMKKARFFYSFYALYFYFERAFVPYFLYGSSLRSLRLCVRYVPFFIQILFSVCSVSLTTLRAIEGEWLVNGNLSPSVIVS